MNKYDESKNARWTGSAVEWRIASIYQLIRSLALGVLLLGDFTNVVTAQEVFIPDPDLNAAIRDALQKPVGPITQQDMLNLTDLNACCRNVTSLEGLETASNLTVLTIQFNHLTSFSLPAGLTKLNTLDVSSNPLTNCMLPGRLTNLTTLLMEGDGLTNLTLPGGMTHLIRIELAENNFTSLILPEGLTNLTILDLTSNQLTSLTLPPDVTKLNSLILEGNPLTTFVLSEPLAAAGMTGVVNSLQNQGIPVFTYPLAAQLVRPLQLIGAFKFGITGPPGVYNVLGSTNLVTWSALGVATNPLGSVNFHDASTDAPPQKFYRVVRQVPPANMVFIPSNTFTMGTPANELHRHADEGPQTTVTISHGFWMGKYEVTQGEYQAVIGSNPSGFPGDLNRPVESVSWLDATNYCARFTQQELAAGRIAPGSHYRLPTEAEWECAARAGTSTRFSYGDDLDYTSLTNHAWYWFNSSFGTHPVGQKLPNPWGLYDMEGNVWEWTLDWYGPYPGGSLTDPEGPASNLQGVKIIRGGAWDAGESDCRSGRRLTEGVSPFISDFIIGFRVVLVAEP